MGKRGLAVRNGARGPSRFHLRQFTWMDKSEEKVGLKNHVNERQLLPEEGVLQSKMIIFAQRTTSHATHKERGNILDTLTPQGKYALHERAKLTGRNEGHI